MEEIDDIPVDLSLLPDALRRFVPLIRKFAIGDDAVREELMQEASDEELQTLANLSPDEWNEVDTFLDEHIEETATPHQDLALVLSSFAEAAAEAPIELDERSARDGGYDAPQSP